MGEGKAQRKKIAVIISDLSNPYQEQLIRGMQEKAYEFGYDILIFSTFLKGKIWGGYLEGELNIFNLLNLNKIDGIIIMPDNLIDYETSKDFMHHIRENYSGAVVYVDYLDEVLDCIVDENSHNLLPVLEHLYTVHGVRDFACMTGIENHPHAKMRLDSFLSFVKSKNLTMKENRIFYGDFWYGDGDRVVESLLNSPEGLPQAICCTSEHMGLSVYEACHKRNIRVPEDVIVTGFDASSGGVVKQNFLTSVLRDATNLGINAVARIASKIEGREYQPEKCSNALYVGKTCGCRMQEETEKEDLSKLIDNIYNFHSEFNFMMEDGIGAESIEDCLWKIDWYTLYLKDFASYYICLCEDWLGYDKDGRKYRSEEYSNKINLIYERCGEQKSVDRNRFFASEEMLPALWQERQYPGTFFFTPLHFMNRCFGYGVLQYEKTPKTYVSEYWCWIRNVCNLLEYMRRYINLEQINQELKETYRIMERNAVVDSLTGVNNRNAYQIFSKELIVLATAKQRKITVVMADLNGLKQINDTYGHIEGDYAIKQAGDAMQQFLSEDENGKVFRLGGDEFAILTDIPLNESDIEKRLENISRYVQSINRKGNKPYDISISIGVCQESPENMNSDKLILEADRRMYQKKQQYKEDRNS